MTLESSGFCGITSTGVPSFFVSLEAEEEKEKEGGKEE